MEALKQVEVVRVREGGVSAGVDRAATEEPLEVRLHGRPFAVIMRTPGADRELAAGVLFAERVIRSADDLATIEYCTEDPADRLRKGCGEPRRSSEAQHRAEAEAGRHDSNRSVDGDRRDDTDRCDDTDRGR